METKTRDILGTSQKKVSLWPGWRWFLAWLFLTACFYTAPIEVLNKGGDESNYGVFAYFTSHHFQYGVDALHIVGPYGFVIFGYLYAGYLFWTRYILEVATKGLLTFLALSLIRQKDKSG